MDRWAGASRERRLLHGRRHTKGIVPEWRRQCGIVVPMGIIGRAQAVLASNFNALISKFEEPGRDIAQLLSEMKEQVHAAERELIRAMGEKKRAETKLDELAEQVTRWEKRAELAVRQGDDGLAREALAQKQRLVAERERLSATQAEQKSAALAMKAEIEKMKMTHQDYSGRQHTIATQVSQSRAGGGAGGLGAKPGASNFDAFERIESAIEFDAAETNAQVELEQMLDQTALGTMTRAKLDEEFRKLEKDSAAADGEASGGASATDGAAEGKPKIRIEP
jgi:phage shock protein A